MVDRQIYLNSKLSGAGPSPRNVRVEIARVTAPRRNGEGRVKITQIYAVLSSQIRLGKKSDTRGTLMKLLPTIIDLTFIRFFFCSIR